MTRESLEEKLEIIKQSFIIAMPTTPDYGIRVKPRNDIGYNVYEIEKYDVITGWDIATDGMPVIVYGEQENYVDSVVNLLESKRKKSKEND